MPSDAADWELSTTAAATSTNSPPTLLRMPVLSVLGKRSDEVSPVSRQAHELLLAHVGDVESYVLPRATHLLQVQNAADLADALARFIDQGPEASSNHQ